MVGVAKAYVTRVGEGPVSDRDRRSRTRNGCASSGAEFGTVTGRERRCGWLDLVALRYAVRLNGLTSLALTKLDVLSEFAEIPVCVRYRLRDGTETASSPPIRATSTTVEPVYEMLSRLERADRRSGDFDALPGAARRYVEMVEASSTCP